MLCYVISRTAGKDGFVITNATRVCNVHFQQSDIVRVPGGSLLRLKIGHCHSNGIRDLLENKENEKLRKTI